MAKFFKHLRFFCDKKLNEDPRWKDLKVILSGPDVPGTVGGGGPGGGRDTRMTPTRGVYIHPMCMCMRASRSP